MAFGRGIGLLLAVAVCSEAARAQSEAAKTAAPERRAVAFLAREVREWSRTNKCFSCHNNGDAARALFLARRHSIPFDNTAIEATTAWLSRPADWKHNGASPGKEAGEFADKKLAAIQFAWALATAVETGAVKERTALVSAAELLRAAQDDDGCWTVEAGTSVGSPVTYGRTLATVAGRKVLAASEDKRFADAVGRAEGWLKRQRPRGVLDAAAVLIGIEAMKGADVVALRRDCWAVIRRGQSADGGWGPFVNSPPEVFDTAVVLLGLGAMRDSVAPADDVRDSMRRGREFLVKAQRADGSWPETTRPSGAESYAQRISTTGWAVMALLTTKSPVEPKAKAASR